MGFGESKRCDHMTKRSKKILIYLILIVVPLSVLRFCGMQGGPVVGRVLDEQTGKPIEGAMVVALWEGDIFAFATSRSTCYYMDKATSWKGGWYFIWPWIYKGPNGLLVGRRTRILSHKAGYKFGKYVSDWVKYLRPFEGTRLDHLEYLAHQAREMATCGDGWESGIKEYEVLRAIYEEGKSLIGQEPPPTKLEQKKLNSMRWNVAEKYVDPYFKMESKDHYDAVRQYMKEHLK
jgi:hypothetical protein